MCPAGTYTDGAKPIRTRCTFCPRGTTTSGAGCGSGSSCCNFCAPGWVWNAGTAKCTQCPINTWSPGGTASGPTVTCTACDANEVGVPGFTLNAGAGSIEQCKTYPVCPGVTNPPNPANCDNSNYIIRKGFHLTDPATDVSVPTTQHYNKKIGGGEAGYYCVECTPGTVTTNCLSVGGSCKVEVGDVGMPAYKKLHESKEQFKRGYHGHQIPQEDGEDFEFAGVDEVDGYQRVKYAAEGSVNGKGGVVYEEATD